MHVICLYVYNEKEEEKETSNYAKKSDCSAVAAAADGDAIVGTALGSFGALMMMIISYILIKLCVRA